MVNYREGSGRGRLLQYQNSARMAVAHPLLGVGPGNWPVDYPGYAPPGDPSISETTGMAANPWPSSDWVAALSERGVPAFFAIGGTVLLLLGGALAMRYDGSSTAAVRLNAVAGAAALGVAAFEGAFDAVLLLPAPTLLVWALAGSLLPPRRERWAVDLNPSRRLVASALLALTLLVLGVSSAGRWDAMRLATIGSASALEDAARRDPGSYRIHMRTAELYLNRGQCAKARVHAEAARALFPLSPAALRIMEQCR